MGFVGKDLGTLTEDGHDFWRATVTLSLPVFDGLLTQGRVREADAAIVRSRREAEEARRQARLEAQSLVGNLEAARDNLHAAQLNFTRSEDALARTTLRYEVGKADYLDVLNAESERAVAKNNLIEARYEVLTLTTSLKRAVGLAPWEPLSRISEMEQEERNR
jgi:outer membrane protein